MLQLPLQPVLFRVQHGTQELQLMIPLAKSLAAICVCPLHGFHQGTPAWSLTCKLHGRR